MGVAVTEFDGEGPPRLLDAYVVSTKKSTNKARKVADDDIDRMNLLWLSVQESVTEYKPDVVGVETYTVFRRGQGGHGAGAGWKALYGQVLTVGIAFHHGIPVFAFRPTQMKRAVAGWESAAKVDVEQGVRKVVANLDEFLGRIPENMHEHLADACGLSICAHTRWLRDAAA